jgi:hypothetical protein
MKFRNQTTLAKERTFAETISVLLDRVKMGMPKWPSLILDTSKWSTTAIAQPESSQAS